MPQSSATVREHRRGTPIRRRNSFRAGRSAGGWGSNVQRWSRFAFNEHTPPPAPFGPNDCAAVSLSPLLSSFECDLLRSAAAEDGPGWLRDTTDRYGTAASALPARVRGVAASRPPVGTRS